MKFSKKLVTVSASLLMGLTPLVTINTILNYYGTKI